MEPSEELGKGSCVGSTSNAQYNAINLFLWEISSFFPPCPLPPLFLVISLPKSLETRVLILCIIERYVSIQEPQRRVFHVFYRDITLTSISSGSHIKNVSVHFYNSLKSKAIHLQQLKIFIQILLRSAVNLNIFSLSC